MVVSGQCWAIAVPQLLAVLFCPFHWRGSTPDSLDDQFPWHLHCNHRVLLHFKVLDLHHFAIAYLFVMSEVEVELLSVPGFAFQAGKSSAGWALGFPHSSPALWKGSVWFLLLKLSWSKSQVLTESYIQELPNWRRISYGLWSVWKSHSPTDTVKFSTISYKSIFLCLLCTPTSCFIYFVPQATISPSEMFLSICCLFGNNLTI